MSKADLSSLRIGCVSYLNSKPFIHGLGKAVTLMHPAPLAETLYRGDLDIALVPVFECFRHPGYRVLDGYGICCRGPVKSVFLARHRSLPEVKKLSLDAASLTSANLTRVLCRKHFKIEPEFVPQGEVADAELWIGDQALNYLASHPQTPLEDLGQAWLDYSGLPFVFAVWAIHPRAEITPGQADRLRALFREGMDNRAQIAGNHESFEYLTHFIRFELGESEKYAIGRFRQECEELGLAQKSGFEMEFV